MKLGKLGWLILWASLSFFACSTQAEFTSVTALPSQVVVATTTNVKFVADIKPDPKLIRTSIRLLGLKGGIWNVLGTMRDDGLGGDDVPRDSRFTLVTSISSSTISTLDFRVSAAYSGVAARDKSPILSIDVIAPLDLNIGLESAQEITIAEGQTFFTTFTLQLLNQVARRSTINVSQTVTPNTGGIIVTSDRPPGDLVSIAQNQTFLVTKRITGNIVGEYQLKLAGILKSGTKSDQAEATIKIRVLPASGVGDIFLYALPGGMKVGSSGRIGFTGHYKNGIAKPSSVQLVEVTSTGNPIRVISAMRDDGVAPDLVPGDLIFSAEQDMIGGPVGTVRYFRARANFSNGTTALTLTTRLPSLPYNIGYAPFKSASIIRDPLTGGGVLCDEFLISFTSLTTLKTIETLATSIGGSIIGVDPDVNTYQIQIPCTNVAGLEALTVSLNGNPAVKVATPIDMYSFAEARPKDDDGLSRMQYAHILTRVDEAWLLSRGGGVGVAVLDSGVDYTHPDLKSPFFVNGYDFVNKDPDSMDDEGHGTKVAGIIGAQGNNGTGIAGVAWDSSLISFKVCRAECPVTAVAEGINAAAVLGAKIINMSFGWEKKKWETFINSRGQSSTLEEGIKHAKAKGVIIVAAAGNDNSATPIFPCAYPGVLCVGSTTAADKRLDTSDFGPHVRVAAPGVDLLTTVSGGGYALVSGTSFAAPYVAGVAALVWASHPTWTAAQVEERILKTGVPLPGLGPMVDAFDAVFNGSFEAGKILDDWTVNPPGFAYSTGSLIHGIIDPIKGKKLAQVSSGTERDDTVKTVKLTRTFEVLPLLGGGTIKLPIKLHYSVLTGELQTNADQTGFPDEVTIKITGPRGTQILAHEVTDVGAFVSVGDPRDVDISCNVDPLNDADSPLRWTAWKNINVEIPVTNQGGTFHLEVLAQDAIDAACETSAIIDNIRFK